MRTLVVLAALAGCGDNLGIATQADARRPRDSITPDATVGTVTVSIGAAHPDVQVYFQAADSRILTRTRTNYAGDASGTIESGGYVTVMDPYGRNPRGHIRTFAGVQPGDHLVMRERYVPSVFGMWPIIGVHAPGWTDSTITSWLFRVEPNTFVYTYGGIGLDVNFEWRAGVTTFDFLFLGYDSSNTLRGTVFAPNIAAASRMDLSAYPQLAPTQHSIRYTGVPTTSAVITESLATDRGSLYSVATTATVSDDSSISIVTLQPVGTGGSNDFTFEAFTGFSTIRLIDRRLYAESFETNVAARLVSEVRTCPVYEAKTGVLSWTHAFYRSPNIVHATLRGSQTDWMMIAPLSDTSVTFPDLAGEIGTSFGFVQFQRAYVPGGYETVRRAEYWPYGDLTDGGGLLGELSISDFSAEHCGAL